MWVRAHLLTAASRWSQISIATFTGLICKSTAGMVHVSLRTLFLMANDTIYIPAQTRHDLAINPRYYTFDSDNERIIPCFRKATISIMIPERHNNK